jgi:hypothetical protein
MTFFDKKEEVIDIELTQYGKHVLSLGKFKPAYYQFFDDDIIYDSKYSQTEELQRDIQTRIKEAVRPHVQYSFVGSEEEIKKLKNQNRSRMGSFSDTYVPYNLKHRVMSMPLANSRIGSNNKPSWNVRLLKGEFSDTQTFITGAYSTIKYPRLTMRDIEFMVGPSQKAPDSAEMTNLSNLGLQASLIPTPLNFNDLSTRFRDGSFIRVQDDSIVIDIQELNVDFQQENFEFELYQVDEDQNGEEELKQLYFLKENRQVVNNLLTDESNILLLPKDTTNLVNNFFNISVDRQINPDLMCSLLSEEEREKLNMTNQMNLRCKETYINLGNPRIISDVTPEDSKDNC